MKRLLTLIFAMVALCSIAFGQAGFREGYVITIQNDSIKGQVNFRSPKSNYAVCKFKVNGVVKEYLPSEIKGYGILGDRFFQSGVIENIFVEVLISGELTVYKHDNVFLLRKGEGILFTPEEKEIEVSRQDQTGRETTSGTIRDTRWKGQLAAMLNDCKLSEEVLRNVQLHERKLVDLARKYNACRGTKYIVYKTDQPWTRFNFGLSVGVTQTTLRPTSGAAYEYEYFAKSYHSLNPTLGAVVLMRSPKVDDGLAFGVGINVTKSSFESFEVRKNPYDNYTEYTTRMDMTVVAFPISLRYDFISRKISPFIEFGFTLDRILNTSSDVAIVEKRTAEVRTSSRDALTFAKSQRGVGGGAGVVLNGFRKVQPALIVKYYSTSKMNDDIALNIDGSRLTASILIMAR